MYGWLVLWLLSIGLLILGGFQPSLTPPGLPAPYPYQGVALFGLITLCETAVAAWVLQSQPFKHRLVKISFFISWVFMWIYYGLSSYDIGGIPVMHALWLLLLLVICGLGLAIHTSRYIFHAWQQSRALQ
jgi:hypothetical protein